MTPLRGGARDTASRTGLEAVPRRLGQCTGRKLTVQPLMPCCGIVYVSRPCDWAYVWSGAAMSTACLRTAERDSRFINAARLPLPTAFSGDVTICIEDHSSVQRQ